MSILLIHADQIMEGLDLEKWLDLAKGRNFERPDLTVIHGGIAGDGFRLHIGEGAHEVVDDDRSKSFFEQIIEIPDVKDAPMVFAIQPRYLIEALAGLYPTDSDEFEAILFYSAGPEKPIIITNRQSKRIAIVMPMKEERKLFLPSRSGKVEQNSFEGASGKAIYL